MSDLFGSIRVRKPKYNRFPMNHSVKMSMKAGKLTPFFFTSVLPGDVWKVNTEALLRFAPFKVPVMHRINVYTHFFFIPMRLVWHKWKEFITGGVDGKSDVAYPRFVIRDSVLNDASLGSFFKAGSLLDYLGFPVGQFKDKSVIDALPVVAYFLVWWEYYRDQNLTQEYEDFFNLDEFLNFDFTTNGYFSDGDTTVVDENGVVTSVSSSTQGTIFLSMLQLADRAWKKDYFTSALPWSQRGDEVQLPLGGEADLVWNNTETLLPNGINAAYFANPNAVVNQQTNISNVRITSAGSSTGLGSYNFGKLTASSGPSGDGNSEIRLGHTDVVNGFVDNDKSVKLSSSDIKKFISGVDLSKVSSATINELRRAIKAQEFLELAARGGSRYIEQIYSYFGVRSSDARLQRPEFLGGGKSPVIISDVLQTSQTSETSPQASPAGHGVGVQRSHSFKRFFEEHGFIIGIMSVMPMPAYQQGMPRLFQKFDRLDYYWPQFAHLGEQEIKESEIYYQGDPVKDNDTFGYAPRYAEYKFMNDSVHGDFRTSLDFWHMGRIFDSPPMLNIDFVTNVSDAFNRPFAVQDSEVDKIWVNIQNNVVAKRLMPKYGTPLF